MRIHFFATGNIPLCDRIFKHAKHITFNVVLLQDFPSNYENFHKEMFPRYWEKSTNPTTPNEKIELRLKKYVLNFNSLNIKHYTSSFLIEYK